MNVDLNNTGFWHFIAQSDTVGKTLFALLVAMSIVSWGLVLLKAVYWWRVNRDQRRFLHSYSMAESLPAVETLVAQGHSYRYPMICLARSALQARTAYTGLNPLERESVGSAADFMAGMMQKTIDEQTATTEHGLTVFATIGATAPFVGLFGTVWGVYHALLSISAGGSASLERVAGPVGEALVMTGIGLAVAVPAVVAYNWLMRRHRVLSAQLNSFAAGLLPCLLSGRILTMQQESGQTVQAIDKTRQAA